MGVYILFCLGLFIWWTAYCFSDDKSSEIKKLQSQIDDLESRDCCDYD